METTQKIMLILLKDLSVQHTISSLAKETGLSRVGTWKILKRLEAEKILTLKQIGKGKTSIYITALNWSNILTEKNFELLLAKEAQNNQRWVDNFKELGEIASFAILFGSIIHLPKEARDIDILIIADKDKFAEINAVLLKIQKTQSKKIHSTNFTELELKEELKKPNKVIIDALKKGAILFGHHKFINFVKGLSKQ